MINHDTHRNFVRVILVRSGLDRWPVLDVGRGDICRRLRRRLAGNGTGKRGSWKE